MRWGEGVSYAPPIPPGLLQSDPTSFIRYGALDNKEEFKMDQEFVKMVRESGGHVSGDAHSDPPLSPVHRALCSSASLQNGSTSESTSECNLNGLI